MMKRYYWMVLLLAFVCVGVACGDEDVQEPPETEQPESPEPEPEPDPEPEPEPEQPESHPLANPSATAAAQQLYDYLWSIYGSYTLSATMAKDGVAGVTGSWNTAGADDVFQWTGKYPAINCFDYGHLLYSPANWIDYNDVTPVTDWWNAGGIVALMWHWSVPMRDPDSGGSTLTLSQQETVMASDWSNWLYIPASEFQGARVGSQVVVAIKDVAAGAQGAFKDYGSPTWAGLVDGSGTDYGYFSIGGDSFAMTLDEVTLAVVQANGLIISGHSYTLVNVVLTDAVEMTYSFYAENNDFDADRALRPGTWENEVFVADLAEAAGYLRLLRDAGIPVLWRPFHEAAGGWFWWGKSASSHKALWIAMFDYFQQEGLDNLIWVWTSETNDNNWYPGDAYVDIIGRDLYGNSAGDCVAQYRVLEGTYQQKLVALSECGYSTYTSTAIGNISSQWASGARWAWFMPWYDADNTAFTHSGEAWWQDAMNQEYVLSRDEVEWDVLPTPSY